MDDLSQPFIQGSLAGQQFQLNKFLIEEAPVKLEKEKLALKIASSDYNRRQQMADMLATKSHEVPPGQDPLTNAANTMFEISQAAAQAGLPEEAIDSLTKGATILNQQESASYKHYQQVLQQTKYADQLLGTIPDGVSPEEGQKLWDQMNAHVEMMTGKPSALKDQKYSPELVKELRDASVKKISTAQEEWYKVRAQREQGLIAADTALVKQREAAARLADTRANTAKKYGGNGIVAKPANIAAVADLIIKDSGDITSRADANTVARGVALEAEALMDREHIDQPTAVAKAFQNAKRDGRIASGSKSIARAGTSPSRPFAIPTNPEELKSFHFEDGHWYDTPSGPQWYDAETNKVYPIGEGPEDNEPTEDEPR